MLFANETAAATAERPQICLIQFTAESRLHASPYMELHNLRCSFRAGILTLMGCVSKYYLWQVAHSLVQKLDGVDKVDNQVVVVSQDGHRNL